mgnify:CR=1 FL=1
MNKRLRKVLRGDVERLVCSNVASGNVHNVEELANVATETMLLRQRLAMMEDRLRSEYNRALADSDHTYKLTVKLVLEPSVVVNPLEPTEEHKQLCKAFDE